MPGPELTLPAPRVCPYAAGGLQACPAPTGHLLGALLPACRHYPEDLHQQYDTQRPGILKEEQAHHDMVRGRCCCSGVAPCCAFTCRLCCAAHYDAWQLGSPAQRRPQHYARLAQQAGTCCSAACVLPAAAGRPLSPAAPPPTPTAMCAPPPSDAPLPDVHRGLLQNVPPHHPRLHAPAGGGPRACGPVGAARRRRRPRHRPPQVGALFRGAEAGPGAALGRPGAARRSV